MSLDRPNHAPAIKRALHDARRLCEALGLTKGAFEKQPRGLIVCCPVHNEKRPSCSVQTKGGMVLWKCHSCQEKGDAIDLVAAVRGLSLSGLAFRDVLVESARLAGLWDVVDELEGRGVDANTARRPAAPPPVPDPEPEAPRVYPPDAGAWWASLASANDVAPCATYLWSRAINPELVEALNLARAIPDTGSLPTWARYRGQSWRDTGHRIIVPMFDAAGELRSVRAWRCVDGDSPKRLPPGGHRASGLVMADAFAGSWLRRQREPERIVIAEGEPDALVNMIRNNDPHTAVIGIVSGSWSKEFAELVPVGCQVIVRTHLDAAGDRYASEIEQTLRRRAFVWRLKRSHAENVSA